MAWCNFCREICVEILERDSKPLTSPGLTVEIDEAKFGKRKFHKDRRVDGAWILVAFAVKTRSLFGGSGGPFPRCIDTNIGKICTSRYKSAE